MSGAVKSPTDQSGTIGLLYPVKSSGDVSNGITDKDAELGKWVWSNKTAAMRWKDSGEFKEAKDNWDYWYEKQWKYQRAPHLTMSVINQVFPTMETFVGHFADNLPESVARARNPGQKRVGEMGTKLLNWTHDINAFKSVVELFLRSAAVTGVTGALVEWDWRSDGKRGAPRVSFVDEDSILLSPWTKNPDLSDCRYMQIVENIPCEDAKKLWPDRADDIKPGAWDPSFTPKMMTSSSSGFGESLIFPQGQATSRGGQTNEPQGGDLCTVIRQWYKQDDDTIRYTVMANAICVEDGPLPYDDEQFPLALGNVLRNKSSAYGHSLVRFMKNLQDTINQMASLMIDYQRYDSNSPVVMHPSAVDENKNLTNAPDSVMIDPTPNGSGIRILTKPGANNQFLNILGFAIESLNQKTGNVDILRGEQPASVTTLGAMEILRDEANVLVKKMTIQLLEFVKRIDRLILSRLKQFMKDERTVRISGKGGQEHIVVNQKVGMGVDGSWIVANTIPDDFEADIDLSPMPPGGMQAKFERAMAMIETVDPSTGQGLIDDQYFFEMVEEDPEMVAQLMERKAQQAEEMAKAEQQAAAQQAGGELPPEEMGPEEIRQRAMQALGGI